MTLKSELLEENKKIVDTIDVLVPLITHNELRGNPVFCDLLKSFANMVNDHLTHEGRSAFKDLLPKKESGAHEVAVQFINNSNQLTGILKSYAKHWCHAPHDFSTNEAFIEDTKSMFHLVTKRIKMEEEKLFPLID